MLDPSGHVEELYAGPLQASAAGGLSSEAGTATGPG